MSLSVLSVGLKNLTSSFELEDLTNAINATKFKRKTARDKPARKMVTGAKNKTVKGMERYSNKEDMVK